MNASEDGIIIKGSREGLLITLGPGAWHVALSGLEVRLTATPEFFKGARVALVVGNRKLVEADVRAARDLLAQHDVLLWGIIGEDEDTQHVAAIMGLDAELPPRSRIQALRHLAAHAPSERAVPALENALSSDEPELVRAGMAGLGTQGYRPALERLVTIGERTDDAETRAVAAAALGNIGDAAAEPALVRWLAAVGAYLAMLQWPTIALGWVVNLFERGEASLGRIHAILDAAPEIADASPLGVAALRGGELRAARGDARRGAALGARVPVRAHRRGAVGEPA